MILLTCECHRTPLMSSQYWFRYPQVTSHYPHRCWPISISPYDATLTIIIFIMTSSNGSVFCVTCPLCGKFTCEFPWQRPVARSIFRVTGPLCRQFTGEFPSQRPVARSFDVFFDLCRNKRLSKQSIEMPVTWYAIALIMTPLLCSDPNSRILHST